MKRCLLLILLLLAALSPRSKAQAPPTDIYGGILSTPCPNQSIVAWNMQKIGVRWVWCTPINGSNPTSHAFIKLGVYGIGTDSDTRTGTVTQVQLSGNAATWTLSTSTACVVGSTDLVVTGTTSDGGIFNVTQATVTAVNTSGPFTVSASITGANFGPSADTGTLKCGHHVEINHGILKQNSDYVSLKYGATDWNNLAYARLKGWGFNSGAPNQVRTALDSVIQSANKVPFTAYINASNSFQHCINGNTFGGVKGQCKNLWNMLTTSYSIQIEGTGYQSNTARNLVDAFYPAWQTYENAEYAADSTLATFKTSPYFMAATHWDPDNLSGFNGGCPGAPGFNTTGQVNVQIGSNQVTWVSGPQFTVGASATTSEWTGDTILLNGVTYRVGGVLTPTLLVLTTNYIASSGNVTYAVQWGSGPSLTGCWRSPMLWIAASAPHQVNNPRDSTTPNVCFTDQTNYTKAQFAIFLKNRYVTIAALLAAWGPAGYAIGGANNTDGFGTDGVRSVGVATSGSGTGPYTFVGSGNTDPLSVEVDVGGVCVGGDSQADGVLRGGTIVSGSSSVTYSSGNGTINFSSPPGGTVTVSFWHGGFNTGHGVLDEAGANVGNGDSTGVPSASAQQIANQVNDFELFLASYTAQFNTVIRNAYRLVYTNAGLTPTPYMGGDYFGGSRTPARCGILSGAGQVMDVVPSGGGSGPDQATFMSNCTGDKPMLFWWTSYAESDSQWYNCPSGTGCGGPSNWPPGPFFNYTDQNARGAGYQNEINALWSNCNQSTNSCNWVGINWWSLFDTQFFEYANFGMVSWKDNALDGNENTTGSVTCSFPTNAFTCGGEVPGPSTFGNFLGPVTTANQQIANNIAGLASPLGIRGSGAISGAGVIKNP